MSQVGESAIMGDVEDGVIRCGEPRGGVFESRRIHDLRGADAEMGAACAGNVVGASTGESVEGLESRSEMPFLSDLTASGVQPIGSNRGLVFSSGGTTSQE
jgi:hypothetical protein